MMFRSRNDVSKSTGSSEIVVPSVSADAPEPPLSSRLCSSRPYSSRPCSSRKCIITWNSGLRDRVRRGLSASTSRSMGTSWLAYAPSAASLPRMRTSCSVGLPLKSLRNTTMFANSPTMPTVASSVRPATGVPMVMSSPPPSLCSRVATAECSNMNSLTPARSATARNLVRRSAGTAKVTISPVFPSTAGRGRSAATVMWSGMPANVNRQYSSCASPTACATAPGSKRSRCHKA